LYSPGDVPIYYLVTIAFEVQLGSQYYPGDVPIYYFVTIAFEANLSFRYCPGERSVDFPLNLMLVVILT
jgi:hypothetical protein